MLRRTGAVFQVKPPPDSDGWWFHVKHRLRRAITGCDNSPAGDRRHERAVGANVRPHRARSAGPARPPDLAASTHGSSGDSTRPHVGGIHAIAGPTGNQFDRHRITARDPTHRAELASPPDAPPAAVERWRHHTDQPRSRTRGSVDVGTCPPSTARHAVTRLQPSDAAGLPTFRCGVIRWWHTLRPTPLDVTPSIAIHPPRITAPPGERVRPGTSSSSAAAFQVRPRHPVRPAKVAFARDPHMPTR